LNKKVTSNQRNVSCLHTRKHFLIGFFSFEIRLVIETLKEVEKERKCFRMIGGVLVERTVGEVLPALEANKEQARIGVFLFILIFL